MKATWNRWSRCHLEVSVRTEHLHGPWVSMVLSGRSVLPWGAWMWKKRYSVSLITLSSRPLHHPWAIRAVEAIVSLREGCSNQDTQSVTSLSPRSKSDALDTLRVLAGLTLKDPLEVVTACLNSWYWAAETFLSSPSSSSSSVIGLSLTLSSGSKAAEKFTGEASLAGESTDVDLVTGERERVHSLVSSTPLALLTGVLARLTGALGRLSGVLGGVSDLLGGVSSLGAGTVDCAAGLAWASETAIPWSIRRCSKVHMDMKSINVAWLIDVGIDGKRGLLTPVKIDESRPAEGVFLAGVPRAAGSSNAKVWRCAGPATPVGSSSWSAGPSVADGWLAGSATSSGPSTMTGLSSLADPSPADPSYAGPSSAGPSLAGSSLAGPSSAGPSTTSDGPVTVAGSSTSAAGSSTWSGRAGEGITVMILFSGDWVSTRDSCTSRLETYDEPDLSALSRLLSWWWPGRDLRLANAKDEDRDLRSPEDLRWWWWAWEEEAEGRASVTLETWLDPEPPVESACLLELDLPEEVGRDRSPSRRPLSCLEAWCLGEFWHLSDPCDLLLRSPLRDLWRSDPSELGRPTTDTLEATDLLGSQDLEGQTADFSTSVAFDPELVAVLARLDLDDPSLERLAGSWRTSSGACISTESSIVSGSWDFFAAFAALRLLFCSLALACTCQASGSQSLQISQGESSVHKVSPSFSRHCWQR